MAFPRVNVTEPAPPLEFSFLELQGLFDIAANQQNVDWQPFREGVDAHRLYGDGVTGPTAALLRFREQARIPKHVHEGYEHILVLSGSQTDEHGTITPGTLRIHPPGTSHRITSEAGCIVLAIYEKPVRFLEQ